MDNINLTTGLTATAEALVTEKNTAAELGSGSLDVYATPSMIALMEKAALSAVAPHLPSGCSTVGTAVSIKHMAATPVGMKVRATAVLENVDGRKLSFRVEAFDEAGKIGEGFHERYIIEVKRFRDKTYEKLNKL